MSWKKMTHKFKQRIIYQDTDAEGVVYYANYLGYFERGRTEMIREMGISLKRLKEEEGLIFAVVKVDCGYHAPAYYDDLITVETRLAEAGGATLLFDQKVLRDEKLLVSGKIKLIAIDLSKFKPRRLPPEILEAINSEAPQRGADPGRQSPPG
jgi:acyl-CoA thioester hydrolase